MSLASSSSARKMSRARMSTFAASVGNRASRRSPCARQEASPSASAPCTVVSAPPPSHAAPPADCDAPAACVRRAVVSTVSAGCLEAARGLEGHGGASAWPPSGRTPLALLTGFALDAEDACAAPAGAADTLVRQSAATTVGGGR